MHFDLFTSYEFDKNTQDESSIAFYGLSGIEPKLELWLRLWKDKKTSTDNKEIEGADLLACSELFFPVRKALQILITLPCTTCMIGRLFSTLRRIKT